MDTNDYLVRFRVLLRYLSELVDESIISEWQAGLITGAIAQRDNIAIFSFNEYEIKNVDF